MKLLIVADWTHPCDEPFMSEVYAKRWQDSGHEVTWVMRPSGPEDAGTEAEWLGSQVFIAPEGVFGPRSLLTGSLGNPGWLTEVWQRGGPFDVVQVRNDLLMGAAARSLAKTHGIPFVFRHSHLKAEELQLGYRERIEGYGRADFVRGAVAKRIRKRILNAADAVFTISPAMSDYHRNHGIHTPLYSVPMGANTNVKPTRFDPDTFCERFDLSPGRYLIYLGTMNPFRRLEFLLDLLPEVLASNPSVDLALIGGRNEGWQDSLRQAAHARGVADSVRVTGWVSEETLYSGLVGGAIGLSPLPPNDVLRTNSPTKVLEYMNMELPTVTTRTPEQVEMVETSGGGRAVDYSLRSFSDTIEELLADAPLRTQMGKNGRTYVEQHRSYDSLCDLVERRYEQLRS